MDLHTHSSALARGVLVEQVPHDTALVDVRAIDAGCSGVDVIVDQIEL